nr:hypothetical protein [Tanacetum cinerariifolium]
MYPNNPGFFSNFLCGATLQVPEFRARFIDINDYRLYLMDWPLPIQWTFHYMLTITFKLGARQGDQDVLKSGIWMWKILDDNVSPRNGADLWSDHVWHVPYMKLAAMIFLSRFADLQWQFPKHTQEAEQKPHDVPIKSQEEDPLPLDIDFPYPEIASSFTGNNPVQGKQNKKDTQKKEKKSRTPSKGVQKTLYKNCSNNKKREERKKKMLKKKKKKEEEQKKKLKTTKKSITKQNLRHQKVKSQKTMKGMKKKWRNQMKKRR